MDILEHRARLRDTLLARHKHPVLSLGLNIPRKCAESPSFDRVFKEGMRELRRRDISFIEEHIFSRRRFLLAVSTVRDELFLKNIAVDIEQRHRLGRLFDIDVHRVDGRPVSRTELGLSLRPCYVCESPALVCRRLSSHSEEEICAYVHDLCDSFVEQKKRLHVFLDSVSDAATRAVCIEAAAAPKPGLVDRLDPGSHTDMDLILLLDSASILIPFFRYCASIGAKLAFRGFDAPEELFRKLRVPGKKIEERMLERTGGVNTHKGLIFSLGLCSAAAGALFGQGKPIDPRLICAFAAEMVSGIIKIDLEELAPDKTSLTHGERNWMKHASTGARGEAAGGFPSVLKHGLPELERSVQSGQTIENAAVRCLLALMTVVEDGNIIARGGMRALQTSAGLAAAALADKGDKAFRALGRFCMDENLSPGGAADLLAVSLFLYFIGKPASIFQGNTQTCEHRLRYKVIDNQP